MTRIAFEHRYLDRHGDGADAYMAMLESRGGWPYILNRYTRTLTAG